MSLELITKLRDLVPDSNCVYEAIESILATCEAPENTLERTWLSVQLALCEFSATGIEFPPVCHHQSRLTECTQLLETRATWWTTFSGKSLHISLICHEYQPQFESRKILETYQAASFLFNEFQSSVMNDLNQLNRDKQQASQELEMIATGIKEAVKIVENQVGMLSFSFNSEFTHFMSMCNELENQLQNSLVRLGAADRFSNSVDIQTANIGARLDEFGIEITKIEHQIGSTAQDLRQAADATTRVLQQANETLTSTTAILKGIGVIFSVLGNIAMPMFLLAFLLIGVTLVKRHKRSNQGSVVEPQAKEDIIFY